MLQQLKSQLLSEDLLKGYFGIEREALRVNLDGTLASTEHPKAFGDKLLNPYITPDFSESQIEMITPPLESLESAHEFLTLLYQIVSTELKNERLWPQSMPCLLEKNQEIPIATFNPTENGIKAMNYRQFLMKKYGGKKQLISGIHFNFSFSDGLMEKLFENSDKTEDFKSFKNKIYLKVARNYLRYRWLLIYFLGATPKVNQTYSSDYKEDFVSFRNSSYGYHNKKNIHVDYDTIENYIESLRDSIEKGFISTPKEFYSSIRLKPLDPDNFLESLQENGIQYLEIRSIDLNPFEKEGISLEDLKFIHLFMLFLLDLEEEEGLNWKKESDKNEDDVAKYGMDENLILLKNGKTVKMRDWIKEIFVTLYQLNNQFNLGMIKVLKHKEPQIEKYQLTLSAKVNHEINRKGYKEAFLKLANYYHERAIEHPYQVPGYEDLELSTQLLISEAIKRGIHIDILDRPENFIQFKQGNQVQLVKQATKTALDSYIAILAMENKEVTKQILRQQGIPVPKGQLYENIETARHSFDSFKSKAVVVKPKSTNFGLGITIFNKLGDKFEWEAALKDAFSHDQSVIVEEFQPGNEYRFLIVDNELVGVLQRIPANVIGDGSHTIEQLIEIKNQNNLRGTGYQRPLEKIQIDQQVHYYLKMQNYSVNDIPSKGQQIYLRENSNISTGGDSLDMTEAIPEFFKSQAIDAVKRIGARICGVDMIIEDIKDINASYSIIELNFNPAIHIHAFPFKGKSRNAAPFILKSLGFK